jgi:hypothetical protein
MISLEDCIALSGLTEEQILAIAEHEQLPEIAATAFAQYLSKQEHGMEKIRDMILMTSVRLNSGKTSRTF